MRGGHFAETARESPPNSKYTAKVRRRLGPGYRGREKGTGTVFAQNGARKPRLSPFSRLVVVRFSTGPDSLSAAGGTQLGRPLHEVIPMSLLR